MTEPTMLQLNAELNVLRLAYAGATRKARKISELIEKLKKCTMFFPRGAMIKHMASYMYFSAAYDASESYADVESFSIDLPVEEANAEQLASLIHA